MRQQTVQDDLQNQRVLHSAASVRSGRFQKLEIIASTVRLGRFQKPESIASTDCSRSIKSQSCVWTVRKIAETGGRVLRQQFVQEELKTEIIASGLFMKISETRDYFVNRQFTGISETREYCVNRQSMLNPLKILVCLFIQGYIFIFR